MNDQEKSIILLESIGQTWEYNEGYGNRFPWHHIQKDTWRKTLPNLYEVDENGDPLHMPLAWRVLQQFKNDGGNLKDTDYYEWLYLDNPADAQRFWLDEVLSRVIGARYEMDS